MSLFAPLWICQNLSKCLQSTYSIAYRYTCIHTLETLKHMYVHTNIDAHTLPDSLSLTLGLSLLNYVSSFALSRFLCEEGPNFSLISFIKRCGEERRKRRRGEGEKGEKKRLGGQIGE